MKNKEYAVARFTTASARSAPHQASDIAKLWHERLSVPKLIAYIGCAVESGKPSVVYGNN